MPAEQRKDEPEPHDFPAADGEPLSPVLLVRGRGEKNVPLTVADGYHRVCASYHLDGNADVPCRLVELP